MSDTQTFNRGLGWPPLFYVLFYGLGAFIISAFGLDSLNSQGPLLTALAVYTGAAMLGLGVSLAGGRNAARDLVPSRAELCALFFPILMIAGSGLLFWYVALEVSILAVTAALPIKVALEREAALLVFGNEEGTNGLRAKRLKARRGIDFSMALALLLLGLMSAHGSESWTLEKLGLLALLVAGGIVSELSMLWVQNGSMTRTGKPLTPARQVFYINIGVIALGLPAVLFYGVPGAVEGAFAAWQTLALLAVGALGVAVPNILRLGMFHRGVHGSELSVLALGFPGAAYVVKILAVALVMLAEIVASDLPQIAVLQSTSSVAVWDLIISLMIGVFVVDRLVSDWRPGKPAAVNVASAEPHGALQELPLSLQINRADDVKADPWAAYMEVETEFLRQPTEQLLETLRKARADLGLDGYRALPPKLIAKLPRIMVADDIVGKQAVLEDLNRYARARHELMSETALSPSDLRDQVWTMHKASLAILRVSLPTARYAMAASILRTRVRLLIGMERSFEVVSRVSAPIARWLAAVTGDSGIERWAHRTAGILRQFFTHEALLYTGLETSWGFRFVIPGTGGVGANMGGWVMMYSGSLKNYLSDAVPMRINPGFTLATAVFVWTFNRPGIGFGPSVPWGNAYVDAHRYKLLIGFDGVGYVRTGEWRGRGPYSTVSGSLPFMPGIRITWNASVFSPGFVPLVRYSTPFAQRMQMHAEGLTTWIVTPFVRGK